MKVLNPDGTMQPITPRDPSEDAALSQQTAPPPLSKPGSNQGQDLIGKIKAALLAPGPQRFSSNVDERLLGVDLDKWIKRAGEFIFPSSWPDVMAQAALALSPVKPGMVSALKGIGTAGLAGGATAAVEGKDALKEAARQTVAAVGGSVLGAGARAATRRIVSEAGEFSTQATTRKVGEWIGRVASHFKGDTPEETWANVVNGVGKGRLRETYRDQVLGAIKKHGDPEVVVPALEQIAPGKVLSGRGRGDLARFSPSQRKMFEAMSPDAQDAVRQAAGGAATMPAMPASKALRLIQDYERNLSTVTGQLSRRKGALLGVDAGDEARLQLAAELTKTLPAAAQKAIEETTRDYARHMAIIRGFAGRDTPTQAMIDKLIPGTGTINETVLEERFLKATGELSKRFTKEEFKDLAQALRRGETNPLKTSASGQSGRFAIYHQGLTPVPVPKHLPKAPVRVGKPEDIAAQAALAVKVLGARGLQEATE